jgi:hypothetical protein
MALEICGKRLRKRAGSDRFGSAAREIASKGARSTVHGRAAVLNLH